MSVAVSPSPGRRERRAGAPVSLALVQHAHQHLITDGYDNREGITEIVEAFTTVLSLHLKYRVPLNLHVSGMLLETIAWHRPTFFEWIVALREAGLLELIGSAYAQNIMPLFGSEHNARQAREALDAYRHFLGVPPADIRGFWVPERVWNTERVAPVLCDPGLANGGYRYVLLDDRLWYAHGSRSPASARRRFDHTSPPAHGDFRADSSGAADEDGPLDHLHAYVIAGGGGLVALPISVDLRYSVPPREHEQWGRIRSALRHTAHAGADAIAIFADDLERSAAVGPWTAGHWRRSSVSPYERFLRWIAREERLSAVLLSQWLQQHPPHGRRMLHPGTYYELAHRMHAGETYDCWWEGPAWRPYRELLSAAERLLEAAPRDAPRGGLWDLAWKQLMACSFETAWHDVAADGTVHPAPWARACASHARSVFVIAAAARSAGEAGARGNGCVDVSREDVDDDGDEEIVLKNEALYAVISPRSGGRLVYLFDLATPGGRLVVGNPCDDWNWQEELNRFMLLPRNHPGACSDVGSENDRYGARLIRGGGVAEVILSNRELARRGTVKRYRLRAASRSLEVAYRLPGTPERFRVECCLSPDYLRLLREGRGTLQPLTAPERRGWRHGDVAVCLHKPADSPLVWDVPEQAECGHGVMLCLAAYGSRFHFAIEVGSHAAGEGAAQG